MNRFLSLFIFALTSSLFASGLQLPEEIEVSFRRDGQPIPGSNEHYGRQERFVEYVLQNWRNVAGDIECLPPRDGQEYEKGVMFNASVIRFGYACASLPPEEYVEFFEKIVGLYEQKRISDTAFENIYDGADPKQNFWSVNWEHPRVQAIFDRIRKFDQRLDKDFSIKLEEQACGNLADNYMYDLPDDGPRPETLPGIMLQRPWASVIRKYEAMTGKRVPADPNFPDHHNTRPSRTGIHEQEAAALVTILEEQVKPWWTRPELIILLIATVLVALAFWFKISGKICGDKNNKICDQK